MPIPLPSNIGLYLKAGALVAAFLAGWFGNGWRLGEDIAQMERDLAEAAKKQAMAVLSIERLQAERTDALAAKAAAEHRAQTARARVVTKTVIEYVQDPNTGQCELPDSWVLAHNQAAGSGVSAAAPSTSASHAAASRAATDRDALIAVTDNYNRCRDNIVQLNGLIEWARSLQTSDGQ